jgi:hypothetical protein
MNLWAQKITVNAHIDSTVIWIGSQAHLSFEVSQQPNQHVIVPVFTDSIVGGLQLVEPGKSDTTKSPDGHVLVTQRYLVTAYDDSLLYIPPYPFVLNGDTIWSKSLSLKVVQPFKIDTTAHSIADIKPVFDPKFDWDGFMKTALLVLFLLILLAIAYVLLRKYWQKKPLFVAAPAPILPPHIIAIGQLDKIKHEKPWQQGRFKEYHTELTDVIRAYVEELYSIRSMEMTSDEILAHLRFLRSDNKPAYQCLQQLMKLADLVKFAKWNTSPDEHELSLSNAYQFVNLTKVELKTPLETELDKEKSIEKK